VAQRDAAFGKPGAVSLQIAMPSNKNLFQASLDHVKPLDAPAYLTLADPAEIPPGSQIESLPNEHA